MIKIPETDNLFDLRNYINNVLSDLAYEIQRLKGGAGNEKTEESLDMNANHVTTIIDPVADQDAATKKYVDEQVLLMALLFGNEAESII
jgi:hypothetical protein